MAIVTNKDYAFVKPRTTFAEAWACAGGIEIVLADGTIKSPTEIPDVRPAYWMAKRALGAAIIVEKKTTADGRLLGFSVDWTKLKPPEEAVVAVLSKKLRKMGFHVVRDPSQSFVDVYSLKPDKGVAVRNLRKLLRVRDGVMYLGDSGSDDPAFRNAEVGVCVDHGQRLDSLSCRRVVKASELVWTLKSLLSGDLEFEP